MKKLALHWKILIGMLIGILVGYIATHIDGGRLMVDHWIKPFGTIFLKLLKMIAIPLIIASLIKGIADLNDFSKFSKIGGRTVLIYVFTTLLSISIGLTVVHIINPGKKVSAASIEQMVSGEMNKAQGKIEAATNQQDSGPLQFVVDMVPDNVIKAMANNGSMLEVIFFVILFGICLLLIDKASAKPLKDFFNGLNDIVLKMVDLIMLYAPIGVLALMAGLVTSIDNPEVFSALALYALTVVLGLFLIICCYLLIVVFYIKKSPLFFLKGISPAQLVAFSTSSSAATLPVTMERVEEHLGVEKEVTSFVCPVGATINMDGTSLYQAVAAVFISQALGFDLTTTMLVTILFTALMASIGSAAVPGAGVVMLIIVLEAIGFPAEKLDLGIAMILAVDRPLDMCRTVVNITGDATVSMIVGKSVGKLGDPHIAEWDDHIDQVNH